MKLAVLSNSRLDPWINWTTLGPPLLEPLAHEAGGRLVCPPALKISHRRAWAGVIGTLREADTLFWMQGSSHPEWPLVAASICGGRSRRSAFVIDAWRPALQKIGLAAVLQRLDPCFVAFREACVELKRRFPRGRFEWMPFGIDTDVFDARPGERDIFAFSMGRRYEPLHRALLRYCQERGLDYRYRQEGVFLTTGELAAIAGRSQYFVVTPPDMDNPARTGGFSPLVMRYLEGLSAGSRLLGVLPKSGEYETLLPRGAILEVAGDGSDLAAKLDADADDPTGWDAVEQARTFVRAEHSWAKRAEQIHARLSRGIQASFPTAPPALPGNARSESAA